MHGNICGSGYQDQTLAMKQREAPAGFAGCEAIKQSPIDRAIDELGSTLSRIEEELSILGQRLSPVSQASPETGVGSDNRPSSCSVDARLMLCNQSAQMALQSIVVMRQALCV